ncbi:MAG: hypothetical protein ACOVOV_17820 [Dolichospermum sp.]
MSIFKTTLSVESTDPFIPVKITATHNNNLLDKIVMGKLTVNTNPVEIPLGGENSRGSFLYVKSSDKNPKQNIVGIISGGGVITLSPGEFAAIPLYTFDNNNGPGPGGPFGGNSLAAFTTNGTAELEYFTGGRGEDVGENVIIRFQDPGTTTWKYFTLDANTAVPGGGPNVFINSSIIDTQVDYGDYPFDTIQTIVNQKGYIWRFFNGNGDNKFAFVNSRGSIIDTENINQGFSSYNGDGRANLITWLNGPDGYAIYFDGDNYWQHEFNNIDNIYVENNWDQCTADGTFPVYIEGYNGGTNEALFFVKGADKTLIKQTDPNVNWSNSYAYAHGNFIAVETLAEGNQYDELITLEIFNTDGTLLKTVDFDNTEMFNRDYYFYGSGKMQVVYTEHSSGDKIFLNYNQLTGKLIGEDLAWTSNYNSYEVICENYYTGYAMDYRPESVAIINHYDDGNLPGSLLLQDTDGDLEVTYIINNDLEWRNYVVPSTEDRYYASNQYDNRIYATDKDFILLSGDSRTSGPLVATRFTSGAEPTRFNLINDLSAYSVSGGGANVYCFGDYRYLSIRTADESVREFIVFDSKVLGKVSADNWDTGHEFNTLIFVDYDTDKEWYFNTSTKKWTLLPTYTDGDYWSNYNEGAQYPVGLGKIAFVRSQFNPTSHSLHGRMITRGAAGNEKELLKVGNTAGFEIFDWSLDMSTETVVLAYKETSNSNWKVRVFDLNFNFLYEVDTEKPSRSNIDVYGKLNYWDFFDNNFNYTHYKFGKLMSSVTQTQSYNSGFNRAFNSMSWWND